MGSYVPNTYRPVPVHTGSGSFRFMLVPVPTGSRLTETRLPVPGSVRGFPEFKGGLASDGWEIADIRAVGG